jgi:hypothetical protein
MSPDETAPRAKRLLRIGMVCLIVASAAPWLLHRYAIANEDAYDGLRGLLYGIAIGTLLLSVWLTGRQRRADRGRP